MLSSLLAHPATQAAAISSARPLKPAANAIAARAAVQQAAVRRQLRRAVPVRAVAAPTLPDLEQPSVEELKSILLDTLYGTERGLAASSDTRAEISELVSQLEARNPTPQPNDAQDKLSGTWRLVYTSNSELISLLALGRLPLLTVGEILQIVNGSALTVENRIELQAPLSKTALSARASLEVRSPKLLQVKFEEGRVATPELLSDINLPASVEVLGQSVDLTPLQSVLRPLEDPLRTAISQLGSLLAGAPDLTLPLSNSRRSTTWLLNTYLDDTLRITRGDLGSVYVLLKDSSMLRNGSASAFSTSSGAVPGYYSGAAAQQPDWEAIEEQDPPATSAPPTVVEPSSVIEGQGSNGTSSEAAAGSDSTAASPADN